MADIVTELKQLNESQTLPSHDDLLARTDRAIGILESEDESYRPQEKTADGERAGGLLDFTAHPELPLIVVPDLHARCDFFLHVLFSPLAQLGIPCDTVTCGAEGAREPTSEATVLDALGAGAVRVVCVGDLFHSEKRGKARWLTAWKKYFAGDIESAEMTAEMQENLALFLMVLRVKESFPAHFHFLKGNHENILNETGLGNFSFRKFADEGSMVYDFMANHYGDAVLHVMSLWEHALPVCAAVPQCVVSHAEPRRAYTKEQIIACYHNPSVVAGLTWTANDEAATGSVAQTMTGLLGAERAAHAVWLSGHRPVHERYALRQNGTLVQIHHPDREQVAVVLPGRKFDANEGVVELRD